VSVLLTLTLTRPPATDLGYLLHKSPERVHTRDLAFGRAHVFYPEATPERCTAALLLEVDPVALARSRRRATTLEPYVNDRPYAASSFMSVALGRVFGTAMSGASSERSELAAARLPLEAGLPVLPSRGGEQLIRRLFEPLGYEVTARPHPLSESFADWGDSPYYSVTLSGSVLLRDLLAHLYVLIPVLDDRKHYWVSEAEIDKLMRRGDGWLAAHPERELIAERYLARQRSLTREALRQLTADVEPEPDEMQANRDAEEAAVESPMRLADERRGAVLAALRSAGAKRVLDLGCGEGRLLSELLADRSFTEIVGIDVSAHALETAARRLHADRMNERQRSRIQLIQGSLTYRDARLAGYDAAVVTEVVEHLEPSRLPSFERVVFEFARPATVIVTTPNVEYNVCLDGLPVGRLRHRDHRFEWTRFEFAGWSDSVAGRFGYQVRRLPIGPVDPVLGSATQMAVFSR
jgi:3' terminal RNA ribose 2'-O-methyltransferase Hen1